MFIFHVLYNIVGIPTKSSIFNGFVEKYISMENFSNRLKQLRENSGISVTELAREIGVDHSNISNWESGKQKINADNLYKLAQFFEVSMEYLLGH